MADCAMADIYYLLLGELLLVFVVWKEKKNELSLFFVCFLFFLRLFGREFFPCQERDFEESKRD